MKLSVVIPVHNEQDAIQETVKNLVTTLTYANIFFNVLIINDNSSDQTERVLIKLSQKHPNVNYINNTYPNGYGFAVRMGLESFSGDIVAINMGDGSDSPVDVVRFYKKILEGYDCVFGSRFIKGGQTINYPRFKLLINRLANFFIRFVFGISYNDCTNAFKMYRKNTIKGLTPFISHHFNLTIELPLKAIVRGYSYAVLPNQWINRKTGEAKFKIKEMGSRYLFIVFYCLIEKWLSAGDYKKDNRKDEKPS